MNTTKIKTDKNRSSWTIESPLFSISNLVTGLLIEDDIVQFSLKDVVQKESTTILEFDNELASLTLTAEIVDNRIIIDPVIKTKTDIYAKSVALAYLKNPNIAEQICLSSDIENYRVFINSNNSWGKTGNCPLLPELRQKEKGDIRSVEGGMVTAVWSSRNSNSMLVAIAEKSDYPLSYCWTENGNCSKAGFKLYKETETVLTSGKQYRLGKVLFEGSDNITTALENYASKYFSFDNSRQPSDIGWSSWDYYLANPTMDDIKENVDAIKSCDYLSKKINLISVDLGWSKIEGDWRANIDFPGGTKAITKYIQSEGFNAGIWTMPLIVSPYSYIACRKRDWLIKDQNGFPVNINEGQYDDVKYSLDSTIPQVSEYVFDLYRQLRIEGFSYFKLDFLKQSCRFPEIPLHKKDMTRTKMLRDTIAVVRDAVGTDAKICACGAPFEAVQGLIDEIRVCDDVKNFWSNIQRSARSIIHRYWSHRRLWNIDSDFLIVRGGQTADIAEDRFIMNHSSTHQPFHWLSGEPISKNEARVWASICVITGSSIILGDRINKLNETGLEIIKKAIENQSSGYFRPLDLEQSSMPSIWQRFDEFGNKMYAIINFFDEPKTVDLQDYDISGNFESIWDSTTMTNPSILNIPERDVVLLKKI